MGDLISLQRVNARTGSALTVRRKDTLQVFVNQKRPVRRVPVEETYRLKVILLPRKFVHTHLIQGLKKQIRHTQCSMLETVQWNQLLLTLS